MKNQDKEYENFKRQVEKLVAKTQFTIQTVGADDVYVSVNGCTPGVVYKLAIAIIEFVKMGILDKTDIQEIIELIKEKYPEAVKQQKRRAKKEPKPSYKIAEIKGALAEELMETLDKLNNGEISEDEIDFGEFMRRAAEEDEDDDIL